MYEFILYKKISINISNKMMIQNDDGNYFLHNVVACKIIFILNEKERGEQIIIVNNKH